MTTSTFSTAAAPGIVRRAKEFLRLPLEALLAKVRRGGCVIDVKSVLDREAVVPAGRRVWRL